MGDDFFWNGWIEVCLVILAVNKIVYGHRMLDMDLDSIWGQLKNKISYRVKQTVEEAVSDPDANEYAAQKDSKRESKTKDTFDGDTPSDQTVAPATTPSDVSSSFQFFWIKAQPILSRIWDRITSIFTTIIIPLILAMCVANEAIVYPVPVRIIFFLGILIICYTTSFAVGTLGLFYLGKFAYDYYVNKMEKREPRLIMPPIFALLPISTSIPSSSFSSFFMYPFRYPKTERDKENLLVVMNDYMESLKTAFTYLDKVRSMPMFEEKLAKIEENMEHLHEIPVEEPKPGNEENPTINQKEVPLPPTINQKEVPLPPTISQKEVPLPPTINQKEDTPVNQKENTVQNKEVPLPPTVNQKEATPVNKKENTLINQKEAPLPPTINQKENTVQNKEASTINQKEATVSTLPNKRKPLPPVNT